MTNLYPFYSNQRPSFVIYITIFIISGDEILSVNGMAVQGMSHSEAISIFKNIKMGFVTLHVARRDSSYKRLVAR